MLARRSRQNDVDFTYSIQSQSRAKRAFIKSVEKIGGQAKLEQLYLKYRNESDRTSDFFDAAVRYLELNVKFDDRQLAGVPKDGPVVFIANHPYGVLDGIVLTWLARKARVDTKVLANHVLCQAPEARSNLLPVDFTGTREALRTNIHSRKVAQETLLAGGAIGVFPAGGVGASENPLKGPAVDAAWHPFIAKLIIRSQATVVPIFFAGQNSRMFQLASHTSYTWRLSLFFFETARRIGSDLDVAIGEPISFDELAGHRNRQSLIQNLRQRTFALGNELCADSTQSPSFDREFAFPRHIKV